MSELPVRIKTIFVFFNEDYYLQPHFVELPYRVIVFPSKKSYLSTTITNAWVAISGTNGETSQVPIPKGTMDFIVTVSFKIILAPCPCTYGTSTSSLFSA